MAITSRIKNDTNVLTSRNIYQGHSGGSLDAPNILMKTKKIDQQKRNFQTCSRLVCNEKGDVVSGEKNNQNSNKKSRKTPSNSEMSYATGGRSTDRNRNSYSRDQRQNRGHRANSVPMNVANNPSFYTWRNPTSLESMNSWPPLTPIQPPLPTEPPPQTPPPPSPPPDDFQRKWVTTPFGQNYSKNNALPFTLMSYNILAQDILNVHMDLYKSNDPKTLVWEHRLQCLTSEIASFRPDILCLQEVQATHLIEIESRMNNLKLNKHLYKQRNGGQVDGCAIFYNEDLFKLIDHEFVEFFQPNIEILDRYNVAIISKFAAKANPSVQFVVATTHLLYNPRRHDVRLAQTQVLLAELDRMSSRNMNERGDHLPIIITGDLNLEFTSDAYRLITEGLVTNMHQKHRGKLIPFEVGITDNCQHYSVVKMNQRKQTMLFNSARQNLEKEGNPPPLNTLNYRTMKYSKLPFNTGTLSHHLNLTSALQPYNLNNQPMASTYHRDWITVDYVFYTKFRRRSHNRAQHSMFSSLQLLSYLELPTIGECYNAGPIPNSQIGSDHYSMVTQFVIYPDH